MSDNSKRTVAVTVRMTEVDAKKFDEAAVRLWPKAVMSRSQVILSFAKVGLDSMKKRHF